MLFCTRRTSSRCVSDSNFAIRFRCVEREPTAESTER